MDTMEDEGSGESQTATKEEHPDEDFVLVAVGAEEEDSLLELCVDFARLACNQATHPLPGGLLFGLRLPRPAPRTPHLVRAGRAGTQHDAQAAFWLPPRGLHVLGWDARAEAFVPVPDARAPEVVAVRTRLAALGPAAVCTAPHNNSKSSRSKSSRRRPAVAWEQLASHITPRLLAHCGIPIGARVAAAYDECGDCGDDSSSSGRAEQKMQVTPFFPGAGAPPRVPRYSALRPARGAGGKAVLACAQAPERLRWVLAGGCDVLGEFQLAFVHFVALGCRRSLEHWKTLTDVLAGAVLALGAPEHGPQLAQAFCAAATAQFAAVDVRTLDESAGGSSMGGDEDNDGGATAFVLETYGPMLAELHDDEEEGKAAPALVAAGKELARTLARSVGVELWCSRGEMDVLLARAGDELAPATDDAGLALAAAADDAPVRTHRVRAETPIEAPQPSAEHVARTQSIADALDGAAADAEQHTRIEHQLQLRRRAHRTFHYTGHRKPAPPRPTNAQPQVRQGPLSFSLDEKDDNSEEEEEEDSSVMKQ